MTDIFEHMKKQVADLHALQEAVRPLLERAPELDDERSTILFSVAAEVVMRAGEMTQDIWDLFPDLAMPPPGLAATVDLAAEINLLGRLDEPMGDGLIRQLADYLTPSEEAALLSLSRPEQCAFLRRWWNAQERPFRPIERLDRELGHARRWRRVLAARILSDLGIAQLLDASASEIDDRSLARWRASRKA